MITTITTTTLAIITSASLGLITILVLLFILVNKEVIAGSKQSWVRRFSKNLNIAIFPFLIVFLATVVSEILKILDR